MFNPNPGTHGRVEHITAPARTPMSLDVGAPTPKDALFTTGVTIVFLFAASLGGLIAWLFTPKDAYDQWYAWSVIGALFGAAVALYCAVQAVIFGGLTSKGWKNYHERLQDWHNATLDYYDRNNGTVTYSAYSAYDLTADKAHHVLLTALAIHYQQQNDNEGRRTPFTRRALEKGLFIGYDNNSVRVGDLQGTQPEKMANTLAQLGLISGRGTRVAGSWVPQDTDEVVQLVVKNWHKLGNRRSNESE